MQQQNLNVKIYAFLCAIIIILGSSLFYECSNHKTLPAEIKEKVVYRDLPAAPAIIAKIDPVKIRIEIPVKIKDTTEINRLLAERDSLANLLTNQKVIVSFSTDTIHPTTHDTLKIECDELNRNINYSLSYAPRQEKITIRTETYIKEVTWWEKLMYGGFGFGLAEIIHFFRK